MRRDRLTFAMMVGMPIIQLVLFGFAINTDPKAAAAARLVADHERSSRAPSCSAMENTGYFKIIGAACRARARADALLARAGAVRA